MIKNDRERSRKAQQIKDARQLIEQNRDLLRRIGTLSEEQVEQHLAPTKTLLQQLEAEVAEYDSLRSGQAPSEDSIERIGDMLVKLRIFKGMTQKALAEKIDVDETQVSRDERNHYKGVSLDRLLKVIKALNVEIDVQVKSKHDDIVSV